MINAARWYITLIYPFVLVLLAARLVMTPLFLNFEYTRPGFPGDIYGLTTEDRLRYAPYALEYLLNGEDIDYLGDLRFDDGTALYNARELRHMRDVKVLTTWAFSLAVAAGVVAILAAVMLMRRRETRWRVQQALYYGAWFTLTLVFILVVLAALAWDTFFTGFHRLFFEGDSWYFLYSDTLIRLFPEQFWFDAALAIGGLTIITALLTLFLTRPRRFDSASS